MRSTAGRTTYLVCRLCPLFVQSGYFLLPVTQPHIYYKWEETLTSMEARNSHFVHLRHGSTIHIHLHIIAVVASIILSEHLDLWNSPQSHFYRPHSITKQGDKLMYFVVSVSHSVSPTSQGWSVWPTILGPRLCRVQPKSKEELLPVQGHSVCVELGCFRSHERNPWRARPSMLVSSILKGLIHKNLQKAAEGGMAPRPMVPTMVMCCHYLRVWPLV